MRVKFPTRVLNRLLRTKPIAQEPDILYRHAPVGAARQVIHNDIAYEGSIGSTRRYPVFYPLTTNEILAFKATHYSLVTLGLSSTEAKVLYSHLPVTQRSKDHVRTTYGQNRDDQVLAIYI